MQDDNVMTLSMSVHRMAPRPSPQNRPNNNKTATQQNTGAERCHLIELLKHALKT